MSAACREKNGVSSIGFRGCVVAGAALVRLELSSHSVSDSHARVRHGSRIGNPSLTYAFRAAADAMYENCRRRLSSIPRAAARVESNIPLTDQSQFYILQSSLAAGIECRSIN